MRGVLPAVVVCCASCSLVAPFDREQLPHDPDAGWVGDGDCTNTIGFVDTQLEGSHCPIIDEYAAVDVTITGTCTADTDACSLSCVDAPVGFCFVVEVGQDLIHGEATCVLVVRDLEIAAGATLLVEGVNGFAIAATGDLDVAGAIDARARGSSPGPGGWLGGGADEAGGGPSNAAQAGGAPGAEEGRGGRGGALFGVGGAAGCDTANFGEVSSSCNDPKNVGGAGGAGGRSSVECSGFPAGAGGAGGGYVFLAVRGTITVREGASINVDGGDGAAPVERCVALGGGGGGSGGSLFLDATAIDIAGTISARGGHGGSSGGGVAGGEGGGAPIRGADGSCEEPGGLESGGGGGGGAGQVVMRAVRRRIANESSIVPFDPVCAGRSVECASDG